MFALWDRAREVSSGQVTFGPAVIPHLVEGLSEFLATPLTRTFRHYQSRLAIGVVPPFIFWGRSGDSSSPPRSRLDFPHLSQAVALVAGVAIGAWLWTLIG